MKKLEFASEPNFAELWDVCLHEFLYDKDRYVSEVCDLFGRLGIGRKSRILDTCAGTGFISLYLRKKGYFVDCMDLMQDEIEVFQKNAKKLKVDSSIQKLSWKEMSKKFKSQTYDLLFCRGNSFIYADGGWNEQHVVEEKSSLTHYEATLRNFYEVLKDGGVLYVDKFSDEEKDHKDFVTKIKVGEKEEDLFFYTQRDFSKKKREAMILRKDQAGKELGVPNEAYDLKERELESLFEKVGFSKFEKIKLESEKSFVVWLAKK